MFPATASEFANLLISDPESATNIYRIICDELNIEMSLNQLVQYLDNKNPDFVEIVNCLLLTISNKTF